MMLRTLIVVALLAAAQGLSLRKGDTSALERLRGDVRTDAVDRLRSDEVFMTTWEKGPGDPKTASDNCDDWDAPQGSFSCGIEFPEHALVRKWIPKDATVMEFGARFGTTSCEIAKQIGNSGRLVSVEPDESVWPSFAMNLKSHNCRSHVVRGVMGSKPVTFSGGQNYASRTEEVKDGSVVEPGLTVIPNYQFDEIESALGMRIDTLLIDCEGCGQFMMDQLGEKIKTQINLVLFEADMPSTAADCTENCMDYAVFIKFLENSGFEMVDKFNDCDQARHGAPAGTWCGDWIEHYAFRRSTSL